MTRALLVALALAAFPADEDRMCRVQCPAKLIALPWSDFGDCMEDCPAEDYAAYRRLTTVAAEPHMRLIVTPRMCLTVPGQGCTITATILIEHPGPDWYCPWVEFRWAEGYTSGAGGDCPPYDQLSEDERKWFSLTRRFVYGRGQWELQVLLKQGDNKALLWSSVEVR